MMELTITQIGNSKGVRIPQTLLRQCGFGEIVRVEVKNNTLVLSPAASRSDWGVKFAKAGKETEEIIDITNTWDDKEWQW
jgi:antitoxin MazE